MPIGKRHHLFCVSGFPPLPHASIKQSPLRIISSPLPFSLGRTRPICPQSTYPPRFRKLRDGENGVHKVYRVALHRRTSTSTPSTLSTNWAKMRRAGIRAIQKRFVGHPRFPVYSKHANHLSNKALKTALATREATAAATASFQAAKSSFGSLSASVRLSLKIAHVLENEVHLRVARIDGPRIALHGFMIGRDLLFKRLYPVLVQNMFRTFAHNPPFPRGSAASESHSRQA